MSVINDLLGHGDQPADIADLARKLGLTPDATELAIVSLAKAHGQDGDTLTQAAADTGLDRAMLARIVEQLGGEGSLTSFVQALRAHPEGASLLNSAETGRTD